MGQKESKRHSHGNSVDNGSRGEGEGSTPNERSNSSSPTVKSKKNCPSPPQCPNLKKEVFVVQPPPVHFKLKSPTGEESNPSPSQLPPPPQSSQSTLQQPPTQVIETLDPSLSQPNLSTTSKGSLKGSIGNLEGLLSNCSLHSSGSSNANGTPSRKKEGSFRSDSSDSDELLIDGDELEVNDWLDEPEELDLKNDKSSSTVGTSIDVQSSGSSTPGLNSLYGRVSVTSGMSTIANWLNATDEQDEEMEEEYHEPSLTPFMLDNMPVYEVMRQVQLFRNLSQNQQEQVLRALKPAKFADNEVIVQQGTKGSRFYMIAKGEAVVCKIMGDGKERMITHLHPGHYFGELALIYDDPRTATVRAVGDVELLYLTQEDFQRIGQVHLSLMLQQVPLLSRLSGRDQDIVLSRLQPANFSDGEYIVRQGEEGTRFYMITRGEAVVVENDTRPGHQGKEKELTRLYEGHVFGEMSLIYSEPRTASVRAIGPVKCLYLSKEDFDKCLLSDHFQRFIQEAYVEKATRRAMRLRLQQQQRKYKNTPDDGTGNINHNRTYSLSALGNTTQLATTSFPLVKATETKTLVKHRLANGQKVVNKYIIKGDLGKGTFGRVKLCQSEEDGKLYAVKIMHKTFVQRMAGKEDQLQDVLRREIAIMKKLNHRNVVKLVEVIDDPSSQKTYLVQEYVQGNLMDEVTKNKGLTEQDALRTMRDLLCGLHYLHFHKVIHRDIKPENILISAEKVAKIADFGTARMVMNESETLSGAKGTPAFMAPEMFDIDAKYTGPAVDVWSLGATLYMMIIGHPPWLADNEIELSGKVQRDELCFPGDIERSMDPHLRNLIQRMLTKDPSLRITLNDCFTHDWITKEGSEPLCLTAQENDLTVSMDESEYAIQNIPERIDSSLNESLEKAHILIKTRLQQQREGNTNSSSGILLTTNERALLSKKISTSNPPTKILTSFRNCTGENPTGSGASTPSSSGTTGSSPNRPSSEEAGRIVFAWRRHKRVQLMSGHKNLSERAKELLLEQKRIAFSADRAKVTEIILPAPPRSRLSNSSAQLQSQISSASTERHRHSAPAIQMPATATGFSRKSTSNDLNLVSSSGINTPADTCAGGLTRCDNSNNLASIDSTNSTLATALGSSASLCPKVICVSSNESGSGSSSPTPMAVKDIDLMKRPLQRKKDFLMVTSEVFRDEGGDYQSRKILFQAREDDFSVASRVPAHSNSIRDLSRRKSSSLLAHKASRKTSSLMNASASSINSSNSNSNPRWSLAETSEIDMEGIECIEVADDDSEIRSDTSDNQGIGDNDIDEDESDEDYSDVEGDVDVDSTFNELIGTPSHLQIVEEDLDVAPINLTSAAAASTSFDLRPIVQVYVSSKIRENLVLGIRSGYAEAKGSRSYMEDRSLGITEYTSTPRTLFESRTGLASTAHAMIAKTYESVGYFAVYDGHNGDETATYLQKELHMRIFSHDKFIDDPKVAIEECCQSIDEEILLNQNNSLPMKLESEENHPCLKLTPISFSGSTGVLALVLKKKALPKDASIIVSEDAPMNDTYLYIANIGDCRAVFCQNGIAVDITIDHKASHPAEKKRIEESGGFVHNGRLDGILAISRGFGDSAHKQEGHLIVKPDVYTRRVDPEDEFVLLASDGLYDVLSSQQAINFIRKKLRSHGDVQLAAQELVLKAQEYFSHDNISVIIICLNQK